MTCALLRADRRIYNELRQRTNHLKSFVMNLAADDIALALKEL